MSEKQETIADLLEELRSGEYAPLAYRIEAALKREHGNAQKMREVLGQISAMEVPHNFQAERRDIADACYDLTRAIRQAEKALSAPPRNCDVGTAEEWCERWMAFCGRYDDDCTGCPCDDAACVSHIDCFARWAQMPYEEGGEQ